MSGTQLTEAIVKTARPKDKRYTLFDIGGLYIEIAPNGGKWWRLRYRFNGKSKTMSLGTYPEVSLREARTKRDALKTMVAEGKSPTQEEQNKAKLFYDVTQEWFAFKEHVWSLNTARNAKNLVNNWILKYLPNKPIDELDTQDFLKVFRKAEECQRKFIALKTANICNAIIKFAKLSGYLKYNPIEDVSRLLIKPKVSHYPAITDPNRIGKLLVDIENIKCTGDVITMIKYALRIMPYVFVRAMELCAARWTEFDFEKKLWTIPAERMKMRVEHMVPLSRQVIELFTELHTLTGTREFCFYTPLSLAKHLSHGSVSQYLRRFADTEMTTHGFRSMASTLLNEQGYRPDIIEMQLAHKDRNSIRAAYNRATYMDERRDMLQKWADYLDSLRTGTDNNDWRGASMRRYSHGRA